MLGGVLFQKSGTRLEEAWILCFVLFSSEAY